MNSTQKTKSCTNFKMLDQDMFSQYRKIFTTNCKSCAYFSSRNCGMDITDSLEPFLDVFC